MKGDSTRYLLTAGWVPLAEVAKALKCDLKGQRRLRRHIREMGIPFVHRHRDILIPEEYAERIVGLKSDPLRMVIDPLEFRYTGSEVARLLGITRQAVYKHLKFNPWLPSLSFKRGRIWQIPASVVRVLIERKNIADRLSIKRGIPRCGGHIS